MKEYTGESGEPIDFSRLETSLMSGEDYVKAHGALVILCHDVVLKYNGGFLLVERNTAPAKGKLWFVGGRARRGISLVDSLRAKVKEECGLDLEGIRELSVARTSFITDPFGHGKGTDTFNVIFYARGVGKLRLDKNHTNPCVVAREEYAKLKKELHPYVKDFLDLVINRNGHSSKS